VLNWLKRVRGSKTEFRTLLVLLLIAIFSLAFAMVANVMSTGDTRAFDTAVILALRDGNDRSDPIGPEWLESTVRDITSLGSNAVLVIITLGAAGFLAMSGARHAAWLILASVSSGMLLVQFLKDLFARVRPDVATHSLAELTRSFPSGHATLSAVTYLTLGALLARVQPSPALKMYLLAIAVLLTLLVGVSRTYLGLHWPTDVLAGWCLGAAWALVCWVVALRLQRRGRVEGRSDR
jgi:undecaprenyl-diphosphatase